MEWTAEKLTALLNERHAGHIRAAQCKMGWSGTSIMDYWVMIPTWTRIHTIGYEIKVSRADFLRDAKWKDYLPACNQFFFCAPKGIIRKDELPKEVGMIEPFSTGNGLRITKQAPDGEVDNLAVLNCLRHVVMWKQVSSRHERAKQWLQEIKDCENIGYQVGQVINKIVEKRVGEVEKEANEISNENERLKTIKEWAEENKIDLSPGFRDTKRELEKKFRPAQIKALEKAKEAIEELLIASKR